MQTRLTELLVSSTVMLAGMGGVSYAALVAAVSGAGGFGCLGASTMRRATAWSTRWPPCVPPRTGRSASTCSRRCPAAWSRQVECIIEGGATVFVAGLGVPAEVVDLCHASGLLVVNMCGKVDHARRARDAGCDMVVAQGTEAGGHTGQVANPCPGAPDRGRRGRRHPGGGGGRDRRRTRPRRRLALGRTGC